MATGTLLTIVLPIFGLIAIGWLSIALRLLPASTGDALADFTFVIGIPLLLFRALGTLELPDLSPWPYWLCYFSGMAVVWAVGLVIVRRVFGRDARAGVIGGVSAAFSNTVFMGIPVFERAFGEEGLLVGLLLIAVHLPVMMTAAVFLIDAAERADGVASDPASPRAVARRLVRDLSRNPLVVGLVAGALFRLTGLPMPSVAMELLDRVADMAIPVALLALGMGLHRYGIGGTLAPAIVLAVVKLVLAPAIVFALATHVFALPPLAIAIATVTAALPTGVNAYLIANHFRTGHAIASNAIAITSIASLVTLSFWLWFLGVGA
jgi:hypothetical protein